RLDDVRIAHATTSRSTRGATATRSALTTAATESTATRGSDLEQRRLAEVNRQTGVIAVGDWTLAIREGRVVNRPARLKFVGRLNRDAVRDAVFDRDLRNAAADRDKQAAFLNELLEVRNAAD